MYMICRKCKINKELDLMVKHPNDKICKLCQSKYNKVQCKKYYEQHKTKILTKTKQKNSNPLIKLKIKEYHKIYNTNNKEKIRISKEKNKEKYKIRQKEYNKINKDKLLIKRREYNLKKYKYDIPYRLLILLRCRLNDMLRSKYIIKTYSAKKLLGCNLNEYKQYLEHQFKPEMNWENYGDIWEIDHIKPCSKFDLLNIEEQQDCFHYSNLQPLFKTTEIAKSFGYENEIGNRNKSNIYTYNIT